MCITLVELEAESETLGVDMDVGTAHALSLADARFNYMRFFHNPIWVAVGGVRIHVFSHERPCFIVRRVDYSKK